MQPPQIMSSFVRVCFVNLIFTLIKIVSFCNLLFVCLHKICEEMFGGCKKSFSLSGQKVNTNIDACGYNANNSIAFNILIKFEATEYSIRYLIHIRNVEDI